MQVYVYLAIVVPDWPRAKWDIDMGNLESLGSEADLPARRVFPLLPLSLANSQL